jgi:hypothetical protein
MERIALTIFESCQVAGVSRTSLYAAIGRGELIARKRGRRTLVLVDDLKNWVNRLPPMASFAPKRGTAEVGSGKTLMLRAAMKLLPEVTGPGRRKKRPELTNREHDPLLVLLALLTL